MEIFNSASRNRCGSGLEFSESCRGVLYSGRRFRASIVGRERKVAATGSTALDVISAVSALRSAAIVVVFAVDTRLSQLLSAVARSLM